MVAAASDRIPRVPPYSGNAPKCILSCLYGPFTLYGLTFQTVPVPTHTPLTSTPTTPITPRRHGFGLLPFRSPLLRKSMFLSFPAGTKMFQFPAFAPHKLWCTAFGRAGSPIRIPTDQVSLADPRGFSQLAASFFASGSQGIPRSPFSPSLALKESHSLSPFFAQ